MCYAAQILDAQPRCSNESAPSHAIRSPCLRNFVERICGAALSSASPLAGARALLDRRPLRWESSHRLFRCCEVWNRRSTQRSPDCGPGCEWFLPACRSAHLSASQQHGAGESGDLAVNKAHDRYQKRQTQQQTILDVRQALNGIELAEASIGAAVETRDLARKNVEAEQQKYQLGTITAFEVLDSQTRPASSETALLNAYVKYQEA